MRDNFRPNVRLTTNILMVIGTFLIAFNLASIGKQDKTFIQRRDDCADAVGRVTSTKGFIKKYKIGQNYDENQTDYYKEETTEGYAESFCMYYRSNGYQ